MDIVPYLAALSALAGLGLAAYFFQAVTKESPGNERMVELMTAIQEGAKAFLRREYRWVSIFVAIMAVLIFALLDYGRPWGAIAYVTGAVLSAIAGFVTETRVNASWRLRTWDFPMVTSIRSKAGSVAAATGWSSPSTRPAATRKWRSTIRSRRDIALVLTSSLPCPAGSARAPASARPARG